MIHMVSSLPHLQNYITSANILKAVMSIAAVKTKVQTISERETVPVSIFNSFWDLHGGLVVDPTLSVSYCTICLCVQQFPWMGSISDFVSVQTLAQTGFCPPWIFLRN